MKLSKLGSLTGTQRATGIQIARSYSRAWMLAVRTVFDGLGRDLVRELGLGVGTRTLSLSQLASYAKWGGLAKSVALAKGIQTLEGSKLKVSFFNYDRPGKLPIILVHKTPLPAPGDLVPLKPPFRIVSGWRPLTGELDRATGLKWGFEEGVISVEESTRIFRSAIRASGDPDVASLMKQAIPKPTVSPWKIKANIPFRFPNFHLGAAWSQGRPVGWAALGGEALNLLQIVSFASFVKGKNPGFLASVLWKDPVVAFPLGLIVNVIFSRRAKRHAKERLRRLQAEAESKLREQIRELEDFTALKVQRKRRASSLASQQVQALRYGVIPMWRPIKVGRRR